MTALLRTQGEREAWAVSLADVAEPTARDGETIFSFGAGLGVCPFPDGRGGETTRSKTAVGRRLKPTLQAEARATGTHRHGRIGRELIRI